MKVFIDGDACPVTDIVVKITSEFDLKVVLIHSTSHFGSASKHEQVEKIMVDNESQAADMAIINRVNAGDIVITGDYGLASLILGKKAMAISFNGKIYNNENIDMLLYERHMSAEIRRSGERLKGPAKRKPEDNERFGNALRLLILKNLKDI